MYVPEYSVNGNSFGAFGEHALHTVKHRLGEIYSANHSAIWGLKIAAKVDKLTDNVYNTIL
jgi:hypothetical protein